MIRTNRDGGLEASIACVILEQLHEGVGPQAGAATQQRLASWGSILAFAPALLLAVAQRLMPCCSTPWQLLLPQPAPLLLSGAPEAHCRQLLP